MPVADPSSGCIFIWLVSCFLFISVATGGTFLILYIFLPENANSAWLPIAGVALVCLPWLFWFFTCFYRIISRALGFRFFIGGGCGGGGGRGGSESIQSYPNMASDEPRNLETPLESSGKGDGKHVQFGGAVVVGEGEEEEEEEDGDDHTNKTGSLRKSLSNSGSSNDLSIGSHESEMPLTSAMA